MPIDEMDLEEQTHPCAVMGLVIKTYEEIIKPALERGEMDVAVNAVIGDTVLKGTYINLARYPNLHAQIFASYKTALGLLQGLFKEGGRLDKHSLEIMARKINIEFGIVDLALQGEGIYDKYRQREAA